jgi:hypothetical protein
MRAPARAAMHRWTFSEATSTMTPTNTRIEMICAVVNMPSRSLNCLQ